jgi:hypothetical protein
MSDDRKKNLASDWLYPLTRGQTLRNFDWMPLETDAFLDSRLVAEMVYAGRRDVIAARVMLWAASWSQDPAGTLPDNDVQLADLAKYGADVKAWQAIRPLALHGFVPVTISGGEGEGEGEGEARLSHPDLARIAVGQFSRKMRRMQGNAEGNRTLQRHRLRGQMKKMRLRQAMIESAQVVDAILDWLNQHDRWITVANVEEALEATGYTKVAAFPKGGSNT